MRRFAPLERFIQDVKFAIRRLGKAWAFALTTILTLAVGIGANATLFSLADAVMFRPFPFAEQDRLVIGGEDLTPNRSEVSYANFNDWRTGARTFDGLAGIGSSNWTFTLLGRDPVVVPFRAVSGDFFDVLGVRAVLGRTLGPADDRRGAARVVVISYGFWQRQFGGNPQAVGQSVVLNQTPFTIVGVMPRGFTYPAGADAWSPVLPALTDIRGNGLPDFVENRDASVLHVVGRLKPGATLASARGDLNRIIRELAATYRRPGTVSARLAPLTDDLLGSARIGLWALLGAVALFLLVASANVAGLMLVQTAARRREFSIRMALGASGRAVAAQLLSESLILVAAATVAGLLMARIFLPVVLALVPHDIPRLDESVVNMRVVAFTVLIGMTTAVVCWIAPALSLGGSALELVLRSAGRTFASGGFSRPARRWLVAAQVAIAVVILTFAGLLYRSVTRLGQLDLGFSPERLLAIEIDPPSALAGAGHAGVYQFYERAIGTLASLPFVESVGAAGTRPLKGPIGLDSAWQFAGQSTEAAQLNPWVNTETITPSYFATMGTRLLDGRAFTADDRATTEPVVIVNDKLARWAWPGQSAIGKRLRASALDGARTPAPWWTVVGVVSNVRYRELGAVPLDVYVPFQQSPFPAGDVMVRTRVPAGTTAQAIRERLRQINPESAVRIALMEETLAAHRAPWTANLAFFGFFAGLTVLLAVVGLYALLASTVAEQSREIGVRLTLGATAQRIVGGVLLDGGRIALIGIAAGMAASYLGARLIRALLFEVSPLDPLTLAVAPLLLLAVAITACAIPAIRASRVDPATSLRAE